MKIKTQLVVTMIIFGVILLIISRAVVVTGQQIQRLDGQEGIAVGVERGAGELSYLSNDYLIHRERWQAPKWEAKWSAVFKDLSSLDPGTPEQQALVDNIKENHQRLRSVFKDVRSIPEGGPIHVSWSRMAVQAQGTAFDASRLSQLFRNQKDRLRQTNTRFILILLTLFTAYFVVNYLTVYRRVFRSLSDLRAGTKVVGAGNLDFAIDVKRHDEIGQLSQAFNRMTASLKTVTASKADLELEVAERQKVEEALDEERERLAVTLGSIGDGVVATDVAGNVVLLNGVAEQLTGWTSTEATGKPLLEVFRIINDRTREPAENPVAKALETGKIVGLANHTSLIAKDGVERSIADSCAPIKARDGSIVGAVLVFRDVTEEYAAEKLSDALNDINIAISSTLDVDAIMQTVVVQAGKALDCETASIDMRGDGYWEVRYLYGLPPELIGTRFTFEETIGLELVVKRREPFFISGGAVAETLNKKIIDIFNIKSMMLMPIIIKGQVVGALRFVNQSAPVWFTETQVDFARKLAASVSLALENARLYAAEHHIAQTLQSALLSLPQALPGIELGHLYHSATEAAQVGGDFYDVFQVEPGKIGILIGDVAGKGVSAATLTVLVENTIKALAHQGYTPPEIMERANVVINRETRESVFVSVFFCMLDSEAGLLRYCNCGHPSAFIKRRAGKTEPLPASSPVIGVFDEFTFSEAIIQLEPGDTLVLYTDGVIESRRGDGAFFGEDRLLETVTESEAGPELAQHIFEKIMDFTGGNLADDVAVLSVSLVGAGTENHAPVRSN